MRRYKEFMEGFNIITSKYTTIKPVGLSSQVADKTIYFQFNFATYNRIIIVDSDYTNTSDLKSALSGVLLYYELAEPIITPITENLDSFRTLEVEQGGSITFKSNLDSDGIHMPVMNKESYFIKTIDVYAKKTDIPSIVTLTQEEYDLIDSPSESTIYIIKGVMLYDFK